MTTQNVHEELQFDYFSQNYYQFQEDFYQFSNLPQPLMAMEDDILRHMASRLVTYFKLSKANFILMNLNFRHKFYNSGIYLRVSLNKFFKFKIENFINEIFFSS